MFLRYILKRDQEKTYKFNVLTECEDYGQCNLLNFLLGLEGQLAKHAIRMLNLLERTALEGPPKRTEVCHQIRGPIYQLSQGRIRILWFYDAGQMIICSHGFIKSSTKTPEIEIQRAEAMFNRYHNAKDTETLIILQDESKTGDCNET